jgi:Sec-independent protein translocase protein TatA
MTLNLPVQLGLLDFTKSCEEQTTYYRRTYQSLLQRESYDKNLTAMMDSFSKALDTFAKEGHLALLPKTKQNERDSMAKALNLIHKLRKTLCEVMIPLEDFFKAAKPETTKEAGKSIGELKKVLAQKEREMVLIQSELSELNTPFEPMQRFMNQINEFAGRKKMGAIMQYLQATEDSNGSLRTNYEAAYDFFTKNVPETITQFEASIEAYQKRKVPDVLITQH